MRPSQTTPNNSIFETYQLDTTLSSTTGTLTAAPATFATSVGDLDLTDITALSLDVTVSTSFLSGMAIAGVLGSGC